MALQQATQKFAEAQRTTGQGAEAISGQREVANQPVREALELASNLLPTEQQPMVEGPVQPGEPPTGEAPMPGENQPGTPATPGQPASPNAKPGRR